MFADDELYELVKEFNKLMQAHGADGGDNSKNAMKKPGDKLGSELRKAIERRWTLDAPK